MAEKTILITGCSSGIGLDAAQTLKSRGWRVFATCRKPGDCARLEGMGHESFPLDYESAESVKSAVAEALERCDGRLDAVFNNGAYAIPGAVEDISRDAMRAIFEANFIGWHDLTRQIIPAMRAQGSGRIIQCSSVLGLISSPWRGAYVASKFAIEGLTDAMRMELKGTGIHVSLIEPGPIGTAFRDNARKQFEKWIDWESSALSDLYRDQLLRRLYEASVKKDKFELPASAVSRKLVLALESPRPNPRYFVTTPTYGANLMRRLLPTRLCDRILSGN